MDVKITNEQIEKLKSGVIIFAPICLYSLLKNWQLSKLNIKKSGKEFNEGVNKIIGIPLQEWPKDIKEDYYKLSESLLNFEQLKDIFAELNYFLIFSTAGYASKYINENDQKIVLDNLFEIFNDRKMWEEKYPDNNAFNKYRQSENTAIELQKNISKIIRENDPLILIDLVMDIISMPMFFINPVIEKLFNDGKL